MGKKYIKCPRCELNYILEGEDYCHICKSEMKHFNEGEDNGLLDGFDDVELCPVCGVNYIKENETMCEECRNKKNQSNPDDDDDDDVLEWKKSRDDDSLISYDIDSDTDSVGDKYNSGFEEIDETSDPYKLDDDTLDDFVTPIEFSSDDDKLEDKLDEEDEEEEDPFEDDFETIEVSDDEEEEDEEEDDDDDDYYGGMGDMLGKKK